MPGVPGATAPPPSKRVGSGGIEGPPGVPGPSGSAGKGWTPVEVEKHTRNGPRPAAAWTITRFAGVTPPLLLLLGPLLLPLLLLAVPLLLPLLVLPLLLPPSPPGPPSP